MMTPTQARALKNRQYNAERAVMDARAKAEIEPERLLKSMFQQASDRATELVDDFYLKYAKRNGVSVAEARKRANAMDIRDYQEKARIAVLTKDFSPEAEEWLRVYNLKMSTSRYELLKANINLELLEAYSKVDALVEKELIDKQNIEMERQKELIKHYKEQAGILGTGVDVPIERLRGVINADFYGADFSERIWSRNGHYDSLRKELFKELSNLNVDMMGYRNAVSNLRDRFNVSKSEAMRLVRTENQRINMQTQHEMQLANGFTHYTYVAEPRACPHCAALAGLTFPIKDFEMGVTAPLIHPNCRCSFYSHVEMDYKGGGSTLDEFELSSKDEVMKGA